MTKKDVITIAKALRESKPMTTGEASVDYILLKYWNVTCENFAYELSQVNPRFNRQMFLAACTYNQ